MTTRRALLRLTFLLFATASLHAMAKVPKGTMTAPPQEGPVQVEFSNAAISKWTDLPLGTYRVPNSDVIISGHQKGGAAPMLLFGLVGVAVQNGVNAGNGKEAMASAEKALTFSIDEEAKAKLTELMADPVYAGKFTNDVTGDRRFQITGAVVLSFANKQDVLPYVTLRVKLMQGGNDKLWTTRYIASKGARRPLAGENSWTADEGAPLRTQVSSLLDSAMRTMLRDIASPYARDEASLVTVKGFFPHVNKPLQVVGYKLGEENGQMLFLPKLGTTIVFAGVNLVDPSTLVIAPWTKKDAPLKLLKPNDPALAVLFPQTAASVAPSSVSAEEGDTDELPATLNEDDEQATAVPSDTDPKAQLREASALADGMKIAAGEFINNNNRFPESNDEAGLPDPTLIRGRYVASGTISGARIIMEFGPGADKSLVSRHVFYEAEMHYEDGRFVSLTWRCKSEDIAQESCPKSCVCTGSPVD